MYDSVPCIHEISAARKVVTKLANLLLKVAQKVARLKHQLKPVINQLKTGFQQVLKFCILDFI